MTLRGRQTVLTLGVVGTLMLLGTPRLSRAQTDALSADVQRVVASARAQGLPPGSILAKAAQGVQVHASRETIVGVVETEAKRLAVARTLLGAGAPDADLEAGASALSYKIPNAALSAVRQARPSASVAVPLGVLTQLVVEGDAVQKATRTVVDVMRRGVSDLAATGPP